MLVKKCSKCKAVKSALLFSKRSNRPSGLNSWCKDCQKDYRINNKQDISITQRYWYLNNK